MLVLEERIFFSLYQKMQVSMYYDLRWHPEQFRRVHWSYLVSRLPVHIQCSSKFGGLKVHEN